MVTTAFCCTSGTPAWFESIAARWGLQSPYLSFPQHWEQKVKGLGSQSRTLRKEGEHAGTCGRSFYRGSGGDPPRQQLEDGLQRVADRQLPSEPARQHSSSGTSSRYLP